MTAKIIYVAPPVYHIVDLMALEVAIKTNGFNTICRQIRLSVICFCPLSFYILVK